MNRKLRTLTRRSSRGPVAAFAVAAVTMAGLVGLGTAAPAHAAEPSPQCPAPGEFPDLQNSPTFTDNNVNVYVGGDYVATGGAAESEGLLVVAGKATIDNGKTFNVGRAGVGSGITPTSGSPMLRVGAELTIGADTTVDVGSGLTGGGAALVGGNIAGEGALETNDAESASGIGAEEALGDFAGFGSVVASESAALAQQPVTGATEVSGGRVTFTADQQTEAMQVFQVSAAELSGAGEIYFENVPADVPILIDVTGTGTADVTVNYIAINGTRVDFGDGLGNASARILWNFAEVSQLTLGGASQFVGSVVAPQASADITASTNGRVYVGGDLRTHGVGNEQHAYPWIGSSAFECHAEPPGPVPDPATGGFAVHKELTGEAAAEVPAGTTFTVQYAYTLDDQNTTDTLQIEASGAVVDGPQDLPVGTEVTFTEVDLPAIEGIEWAQPVISIGGEESDTLVVAEDEVAEVVVTNTAMPVEATPEPTPTPEPTDPGEQTPPPGPTDPGDPGDSAGSDDPAEPAEPGDPADPANPARDAELPATGVGGAALLGLLALGMTGLGTVLVLRRRRANASVAAQ